VKFRRPKITEVLDVVEAMFLTRRQPLFIKLVGTAGGFDVSTQPSDDSIELHYATRSAVKTALEQLEKKYHERKQGTAGKRTDGQKVGTPVSPRGDAEY
jgi:hypothetical protein